MAQQNINPGRPPIVWSTIDEAFNKINSNFTELYQAVTTVSVDFTNLSSDLLPDQDEQRDLGSSSKRWRDLYLSGSSLYLGNAVITANGLGEVNLPAGTTIAGTTLVTTDEAAFGEIAVPGQPAIESGSLGDILNLIGDSGVEITTDNSTNTITIGLSDNIATTNNGAFGEIAVPGQPSIESGSLGDTVNLVSTTGIEITTDNSTKTITIGLSERLDIKGSVFADDSSLMVDAVNGIILAPVAASLFGDVLDTNSNVLVNSSASKIVGNIETNRLRTTESSIKLGFLAGGAFGEFETQGTSSVAIGESAGQNSQGNYSIAIGQNAGQNQQGNLSTALGTDAGNDRQGSNAVALGFTAGYQSQGNHAVAIGSDAGALFQSLNGVAIGTSAGRTNQGINSVAIGAMAGFTNQSANSIILNATGVELNSYNQGLYVDPIRNNNNGGFLRYNPNTKEVGWSQELDSEGDINININISDSTLRTWRFGEDGELTLPGNLVFREYSIPGFNGGMIRVTNDGIEINVNDHKWIFNQNDGILTIPQGGDIVDYTGASVLGGGGFGGGGGGGIDGGFVNFNVAADDSTQRVINSGETIKFIGTNGITTTSNAEGYITISGSGALGNLTITGTDIDSTDSSSISFTPVVVFNSDVTVENDLIVNNRLSVKDIEISGTIISQGSGTPEIYSDSDILLSAGTRVIVASSPLKLATFTTSQRDLLSAQNGDIIYNSTVGKLQNYVAGQWDDVGSGSGSGTLSSRTTAAATTGSLADAATGNITVTGFKGYMLYKIQTSHAAWVRVYTSVAARSADSARSEGVDPNPGAGVIAEVITTGSQTVIISPGVVGFNDESPVDTNIQLAVTNKSGGLASITVTLTVLKIED